MANALLQPIVSPRRIPAQARARHKIDVILEATAQILAREGEDGLSTNKIAERAGVSIGTLYQYFADKDAVVSALLDRERERSARRVEAAIGRIEPGSPDETIRQIVRIMIESFAVRQRAKRSFARVVMRLSAARNAPTELDRIARLIVERQPQGARPFDTTDVFVLTRAVVGALRAAVLEEPSRIETPELENALVRLVTGYMR